MILSFEPKDRDVVELPQNYLPVALPAWQGKTSFAHILIPENPIAEMGVISASQMTALGGDVRTSRLSAFGPQTGQENFEGIKIEPASNTGPATIVLAVIDVGIAFWNKGFLNRPDDLKSSAFVSMGFMGFDETKSPTGFATLNGKALEDQIAKQDSRKIFGDLATTFPDSIYAHGLSPDGFSHGTAMAHQMFEAFRRASNGERKPEMIGIELPAAAFHDSSGSILQALLPRAVAHAYQLANEWAAENSVGAISVHTVMSYGATGGPHSAEHPLVPPTSKLLDGLGGQLFIPTGNHLQDQLHARFDTNMRDVGWLIPHDDGSANTVELHGTGSFSGLWLTPPAGDPSELRPTDTGLTLLKTQADKVIGAALVEQHSTHWRTILTLGATRPDTALPVPPSGLWQLRMKGSDPVSAWVQRDDHLARSKRGARFRQSRFDHPDYVEKGRDGRYHLTDTNTPPCPIKRSGSASVLTALPRKHVQVVGATEDTREGKQVAWYSGAVFNNDAESQPIEVHVDHGKPSGGTLCLINGSNRKRKVSGTSVAAAIKAGEVAGSVPTFTPKANI